jgi:hypothetical protein
VSARIINISPELDARPAARIGCGSQPAQSDASHRFEFWNGASGQRYVHTIYSLIECPELPRANYVLVRRDAAGERHVLRIGRLDNKAGSLNLAEIRHSGAKLGANEVHVHLLARTAQQRHQVELDLCAALSSDTCTRAANT